MKSVVSKIKLNTAKINQLNRATITALEQTTEALKTEVVEAQVMPFDLGTMQNDSTFVDFSKSKQGQTNLVTSTPYSRRMYFHPEYNFQTKENAYAQGLWYDPWIKGKNKDFCKKVFSQFYKKGAGL